MKTCQDHIQYWARVRYEEREDQVHPREWTDCLSSWMLHCLIHRHLTLDRFRTYAYSNSVMFKAGHTDAHCENPNCQEGRE